MPDGMSTKEKVENFQKAIRWFLDQIKDGPRTSEWLPRGVVLVSTDNPDTWVINGELELDWFCESIERAKARKCKMI